MMNMLGLGGGVDTKEVAFSVNEKTGFDDIYHLGGERQPVALLASSKCYSNPTAVQQYRIDHLKATRRSLVVLVYAYATAQVGGLRIEGERSGVLCWTGCCVVIFAEGYSLQYITCCAAAWS